MIRPLRQVHRYAATALLLALPASLMGILLQRPAAVPAPEAMPGAFQLRRIGGAADPQQAELTGPFASLPEVLVYWSATGATHVDRNAVLLGRVDNRRAQFELPGGPGRVLLYSPAQQRLVAKLEPPP